MSATWSHCVATSAEGCTGRDVDPEAGQFRVEDLDWGDYTLVETKAPAGHQLMAKPARFKVTDTGIELITATPGGSALTVSRSGASKSDDTITVRDLQIGTLPLSGGRGIGMNIAVGIAAITGAGLLALRQRKTSSFGRSA